MPHPPVTHGLVQEVDVLNEETEEGDDTPPSSFLPRLGDSRGKSVSVAGEVAYWVHQGL